MGKVLGNQELNLLKQKSPFSLPDNPSDKGLSATQIKAKFWEGLLLLFNWLKESQLELADDEDLIDVLYTYFTNGKANFAVKDQNGNVIDATYETKTSATAKYNANKDEIDKIKDGTTVVEKASKDEDGVSIKTYGKSLTHGLTGDSGHWTFTFSLLDKSGNVLDTETQVFGSATTTYAGLLSAADKAKINAIASDIATCLASAKLYTDDKVARTNLVTVLGEASQSLNGLMSATDKTRLDTLFALLGDSADGDSVVNTINEVLAIFDQYPEGADLVGALAAKVAIADIVDNLTTQSAVLPLSAKQGYILKGLIDDLALNKADAASVYTKLETYSRTEADDKFRTESQVDDQIDEKLANVSNMNVIADIPENKNYSHQMLVRADGELVLRLTEIE